MTLDVFPRDFWEEGAAAILVFLTDSILCLFFFKCLPRVKSNIFFFMATQDFCILLALKVFLRS